MNAAPTVVALERVAAALRSEGGLLADALREAPVIAADDPGMGSIAAAGPRSGDDPATVAAVVEAVREGHLLHGGDSRILDASDLDLALLAGDRLYALGLDWLAGTGDMAAVRELADLIAFCAQARAQEEPATTDAVWAAAVAAIGWGATGELDAGKAALRAGEAGAATRVRAAARKITGGVGPSG
ncbi:unannotated protein [freshwater metagenome]|uniref:Unannotated protein n=1 Tax=freshwater metagenome TaxID=449393 RepID=A0A6J7EHY0_9ZZZZ|nr:hypothetical protein [Actinomycetota bacterium]